MQSIKIDIQGKGQYHWEDLLLEKQRIRTESLLTRLNIDPWTKRKVSILMKKHCTRDNIVKVYAHPINKFLHSLLHNKISELETHSSNIKI